MADTTPTAHEWLEGLARELGLPAPTAVSYTHLTLPTILLV